MSPARKRGILIGAALAVVAIVVAAVVLLVREDRAPAASGGGQGDATESAQESPAQVAGRFLRLFDTGDLTTAPVDDPAAATTALSGTRAALNGASVRTSLGEVPTTPGNATTTSATFHVSWAFAGNSAWKYEGKLDLVRNAGKWVVRWAMSVIHPKLEAGQRLSLAPVAAKPIVADRDGKALVGGDATGVAPILQGALSKVAAGENSGTGATVTVSRVDVSGKPVETLFGQAAETDKPLVSTLSVASQNAAQKAVDGFAGPAIIVAMKTSGELLAVAQNGAAGNQPKALNGLYSPGSAFKIATATAALQQGGVSADSPLPCPGSEQIGTRTLKNDNGFDLGTVSLKTAFAASCNTTFGRLAGQLPADGLAKAASQLGLNADFEIPGLATEAGKVEPSGSGDEQVEAGIGQGRVQVSPLGAALMAATVATGKPVVPKLWQGLETKVNAGYQAPPAGVLNQVRAMMREVCTTGTAKALKGSGAVFGKTGTAQFGSGADANGWFVGYRGDVAFAVMLEGSNDSKPAVQLAAKFLAG
ncbi:penicillin-binding transpeptidase domain-containing protein [Amycolatopsis keratiniphila]|uniref:Penicillin-binding protein n=1 Tax=Amycolatopsis keratiniphila subsp. keratiniphila TaxID=227715 RepID=A0A1W2M2J0_9PSEU|nr:penicillin-binding transpeptidase domain-containing protein [Amycolatopsis keratiniphila]OLZ60917.1 penicillin-binding protein [Amycolatopsis keratiniphila subsp. nogabecina]ONF74257.1 penicillin-binding protein [Amycolatopsis keratiniphila subsp. keratiniphila]SDT99178.1 NTF2-like N-terminal transpeptidase domain-containing protein [Amycolatopsis keratiniphila]